MGGHGHAMGAPRLGLGARSGDAVEKEAWAPRHAYCLWSDTSSAQAHARQRTGSDKAAQGRAQGSAPEAHRRVQATQGSTQAAHRQR